MAQPPLMKAPKFGAWLAEQWDNLTLQQVVNKLKPFLGPEGEKLGRSNIKKWIDGRVPSWAALLAMSAAFQWPISEVLARLSDELAQQRDLPCQSGTTTSPSHKGDAVAANLFTPTRVRELEARIEELTVYEKIVFKLRPLISEAAIVAGGSGATSGGAKSTRRRRR